MKLTVEKSIKCNRYSVVVKFKEFGSNILTPEDEQKLIDDFCPKFRLSDITFEDKYKVENNKIIKDDGTGEDVNLTVPNKEIAINELLEFGYTIHSDQISDSEIQTQLKTSDLVCKAKIQLFVDKVSDKIDTILTELAKALDGFEETEEIEVG